MIKGKLQLLMTFVCGLCLVGATAWGAAYVEDTFDAGLEGWEAGGYPGGGAYGTIGNNDLDGDSDTDLSINVPIGDGGKTDKIYIDSSAGGILGSGGTGSDFSDYNFGGSSLPVEQITFDFWANADKGDPAQDSTPASLVLYFIYDAGGAAETEWQINIFGQLSQDGWNPISVGNTGWTAIAGTASWDDSWAAVDELGILIGYNSWNTQEYGIDNFQLVNPEPGTYAVLAFALVSLGVTFRQKLRQGLKDILQK